MMLKTVLAAVVALSVSIAPAQASRNGGWHGGWHGGYGGWHGGHYWHGGYWYGGPWLWWGPVVVAGINYTVVDGVWYRDYGYGYVPVDPPPGYVVESTTTSEGPAPRPPVTASADNLFAYPKNGQTEQQQSQDRYDCHKWASGQTGFDPTQNQGGVAADQVLAKRADYRRAFSACLEGRGYTVR